MSHRLRRRPSPAMVVALLALFVALDGPATAARLIDGKSIRQNSITSSRIRNRTLGTQDLSRRALTTLERTPKASVGSAELRPKAVDATKLADSAVGASALAARSVDASKLGDASVGSVALAPAAVTPSKIADGAVGAAAVADGGLQAPDIGDFFGSMSVDFLPFKLNECQKAEEPSPTPTAAGGQAQIGDDVIIVTPASGFSDLITVTANPGVNNSLRLIACRVGKDPSDPADPNNTIDPPLTRFFYLGLDAP
jgi:hypothetical protein